MIDSRLNQAQILLQQGRYAEAEKLLKEVMAIDPNDVNSIGDGSKSDLYYPPLTSAKLTLNRDIDARQNYGLYLYGGDVLYSSRHFKAKDGEIVCKLTKSNKKGWKLKDGEEFQNEGQPMDGAEFDL